MLHLIVSPDGCNCRCWCNSPGDSRRWWRAHRCGGGTGPSDSGGADGACRALGWCHLGGGHNSCGVRGHLFRGVLWGAAGVTLQQPQPLLQSVSPVSGGQTWPIPLGMEKGHTRLSDTHLCNAVILAYVHGSVLKPNLSPLWGDSAKGWQKGVKCKAVRSVLIRSYKVVGLIMIPTEETSF